MEERVQKLSKLSTWLFEAFLGALGDFPVGCVGPTAMVRLLATEYWEDVKDAVEYMQGVISKDIFMDDAKVTFEIVATSPKLRKFPDYWCREWGVASGPIYSLEQQVRSFSRHWKIEPEEAAKTLFSKADHEAYELAKSRAIIAQNQITWTLESVLTLQKMQNKLAADQKPTFVIRNMHFVVSSVDVRNGSFVAMYNQKDFRFKWSKEYFYSSSITIHLCDLKENDGDCFLGVPSLKSLCEQIVWPRWRETEHALGVSIPEGLEPPLCVKKRIRDLKLYEECTAGFLVLSKK